VVTVIHNHRQIVEKRNALRVHEDNTGVDKGQRPELALFGEKTANFKEERVKGERISSQEK